MEPTKRRQRIGGQSPARFLSANSDVEDHEYVSSSGYRATMKRILSGKVPSHVGNNSRSTMYEDIRNDWIGK